MTSIEKKLIELNNTQEQERDDLINSFIRQRYSLSQELAISRKRDVSPEKFKEFFGYCEECIARADEILAKNEINS